MSFQKPVFSFQENDKIQNSECGMKGNERSAQELTILFLKTKN